VDFWAVAVLARYVGRSGWCRHLADDLNFTVVDNDPRDDFSYQRARLGTPDA